MQLLIMAISDGRLDVDGPIVMAGYNCPQLPLNFIRVGNNFH
jgi:hypothetical protein